MDIIKYENFSKAGTDSLKKYLHLLSKKRESKHISKNKRNINDEDENDSIILQEDIFNKTYENKIPDTDKKRQRKSLPVKSACSYVNKRKKRKTYEELLDIFKKNLNVKYERYRYHLLHHNDNSEIMYNPKDIGPSASKYQPKFEYIYRKLIYSIPFKKMSGRKSQLSLKKIKENNEDKRNNSILEQLSIYNKFASSLNMNNSILKKVIPNKSDIDIKNKQNKGINKNEKIQLISPQKVLKKSKSPDSPDSKISKNFSFTNNELKKIKKVKSNHDEIIKSKGKIKKNVDSSPVSSIKIIKNKPSNLLSPYKTNSKNNTNSKLILLLNAENIHDLENNKNNNHNHNILDQTRKYKGINFKKMLSREYLNKIKKIKEPIHPMITPNYASVEPKTIMKVIYSKSKKDENKKDVIAYNNDFSYDINNIFDKYNNHHSPKIINLGKMRGRYDKERNDLPLFMLNSYNRNSLDYLSENSLKMNNYSKGYFNDIFSSFNEKKSFNVRLKLDELKKENKIMDYNDKYNMQKTKLKKIKYSYEKEPKTQINFFPKSSYWKDKLGEFYKKDYDDLDNNISSNFIGSKVDGITFKLYKSKSRYNNLLNKHEKELFSPL